MPMTLSLLFVSARTTDGRTVEISPSDVLRLAAGETVGASVDGVRGTVRLSPSLELVFSAPLSGGLPSPGSTSARGSDFPGIEVRAEYYRDGSGMLTAYSDGFAVAEHVIGRADAEKYRQGGTIHVEHEGRRFAVSEAGILEL